MWVIGMKKKTNIFDREYKFREFLIKNWEYINEVILYKDNDTNILNLYAYNKDTIAVASEKITESFNKYIKIYKFLSINYNFDVITKDEDIYKLRKHR